MDKAFNDLGITVRVYYVGVENGNHVWLTQILEVESSPKKFYRSTTASNYTAIQVADSIAKWYKSPHG